MPHKNTPHHQPIISQEDEEMNNFYCPIHSGFNYDDVEPSWVYIPNPLRFKMPQTDIHKPCYIEDAIPESVYITEELAAQAYNPLFLSSRPSGFFESQEKTDQKKTSSQTQTSHSEIAFIGMVKKIFLASIAIVLASFSYRTGFVHGNRSLRSAPPLIKDNSCTTEEILTTPKKIKSKNVLGSHSVIELRGSPKLR